ncbi:MAG TPA: AAA family ATPase [Pseudonocardiaceae bacterium]|nr:AAA family ATPase [Pseudonocardiaceae bacterium]
MRIRSVTAQAFGPLRGETLEFADGLTVVVGNNESGKSSWHAAMFAALCGRRRGRGRPSEDEQRFVERHKPWDYEDWVVSARISLDNGRRIELRHDLAGRVDCQARDLDIGQDVSSEVMHEGSPDGSRWLGLDRSAFVSTACVEQAQLLRVRGDANCLQRHLQRAAATAATDTTTAAALERIDAFQREQVGTDRVNSTKPLRRAIQAVDQAECALELARRDHVAYLARIQRVDELRQVAAAADAKLHAYEAAAAAASARLRTDQAARARELYAVYGDTMPVLIPDDDELARQVMGALAAWQAMPPEPVALSQTSQQLREELSALPILPEGDVEEHPTVRRALDRVHRGQAQLELHDRDRPFDPAPIVSNVAATDDELLDLARALEKSSPDPDPRGAHARRTVASGTAEPSRRGMATPLLVVGSLIAAIGALILLLGGTRIGIAVFILGAALLIGGTFAGTFRRNGVDSGDRVVPSEDSNATLRREWAVARCRELDIAANPALLREMPKKRAQAELYQRWVNRRSDLNRELTAAADELAKALSERGQPAERIDMSRLDAAVVRYQDDCRARAAQALEARRRDDLTARLDACQAAETRASRDTQERDRARQRVIAAARACSLPAQTPSQAADALQEWSAQRMKQFAAPARAQQEWAELRALLEGGSIAELTQSARSASEKAAQLAAVADQEILMALDETTAAARLPELRLAAPEAHIQAAAAEGELHALTATIRSVADAEETAEAAAAELARVRELEQTLNLTRDFLRAAEGRVHREVAPVLAQTVKRWLPTVTGGRYVDVTVNPTDLEVRVCGPTRPWRSADLLSYGTAEQIYLLLRAALADHLTRGHDTCPLLLDDVTVHADADRTRNILDLLLDLSAERQIVVFTQEEQVEVWARQRLTSPRHAIVRLPPIGVV